MTKSRLGASLILHEAVFILVPSAAALEAHTTGHRVNNECRDGCDQPEQVEKQIFCSFHDICTGTYTCKFALILFSQTFWQLIVPASKTFR